MKTGNRFSLFLFGKSEGITGSEIIVSAIANIIMVADEISIKVFSIKHIIDSELHAEIVIEFVTCGEVQQEISVGGFEMTTFILLVNILVFI